jgi:hypothetical protein
MYSLRTTIGFVETVLSSGLFRHPGHSPSLHAPDASMGLGAEMLRDDFNYVLATWFINSVRPKSINKNTHYAHLFSSVRDNLKKRFPHTSSLVLNEASHSVASLLQNELSVDNTRRKYSTTEKYELLSKSDRRCGACGFQFTDEIVDQFLGGTEITYNMFPFYDFLKPTRRSPYDFRIEIDHTKALKVGGSSELYNMQLLCGFCNSAKFTHQTIFDPAINYVEISHHALGSFKLINWFLVVRMLLGNSCFFCGAKATSTELTITPIVLSDEINPINAQVTCYDCDPLTTNRYLASSSV